MSEINQTNKQYKKIKILVIGDSPACATGFANVIHGIFKPLVETGRYEVDVFGINDRGGWKDPKEYPYRIWPAMLPGVQDDVYGRVRFINILRGGNREVRPPWDIVFTLNDPFIFEAPMMVFNKGLMEMIRHIYDLYRQKAKPEMWFSTVSYWPVDSSIKENWVEKAIGLSDYSVAYTKYGKREIEKANNKCSKPSDKPIDVIYHGTDTKSYFPLPKKEVEEFKSKFFKNAIQPSTFIVGCVARNQMRKDLPRVMKIFREFQKRRPDSFLYIHAQETDVWGSLMEYARNFNLEHGKDWTFPGNFDPNIGYPRKTLNLIYNMMDVNISTSLGEGWGLCLYSETLIKTRNGYKEIKNINIGEFVLTRVGYREVLDKKQRDYSGELIEITVKGRSEKDSLKLTPSHQILTNNGWKKASEIDRDDVLYDVKDEFELYSRQIFDLAEYCDGLEYCRTEKYIWSYGSRKRNYKRYVYLNKDFAELYGLYLAEGSACRNGIVFSISQDERELTDKLRTLIQRVWGLNVLIEDDKKSKKRWVRICGVVLRKFYEGIAGRGAKNKEIKIYDRLTKHTATKILKGFWTGDGSREKYGYEMTTCSRKLAYGLSALGDRIGIRFTIEHNNKRDSYRLRTTTVYAYNFSMILGNQSFEKYKFNKRNNELKIKNIRKIKYSGLVYDLGINDEHEFMTHHCLVHNCITEAMLTKTLNLAPNITSIPEIFDTEGEDMDDLTKIGASQNIRGIPLKSGLSSSEWATYGPDDYERIRPLTNVDDAVKKLVWIYDNQDKVKGIVDRAYDWVQKLSWDKIAHEWDIYLQKVYNSLLIERKQGEELIQKGLEEQVKEKLEEKPLDSLKEKDVQGQASNSAETKSGES